MRALSLLLVAACGGRAPDRAPDAGPPAPPDAAVVSRDAAPPPHAPPTHMLAAKDDPWSPSGPRAPDPPPPTAPLPPRPAKDAPEPADREVVLPWDDARVRVHLPIGNWYEDRPILIGTTESPWREVEFYPTWHDANIVIELEVRCQGACDEKQLPANIVETARRDFARSSQLVRRWIVAPHQVAGLWSWRFEGRDKIGTLREGEVGVDRILPKLGAFLECKGTTLRRANPIWLDRIDAICRQLTFEVVPR